MATALTVILYSALVGGVAAVAGGLAARSWRSTLFAVATVLFFVAGALGILSIGVYFLVASLICATVSLRSRGTPQRGA